MYPHIPEALPVIHGVSGFRGETKNRSIAGIPPQCTKAGIFPGGLLCTSLFSRLPDINIVSRVSLEHYELQLRYHTVHGKPARYPRRKYITMNQARPLRSLPLGRWMNSVKAGLWGWRDCRVP